MTPEEKVRHWFPIWLVGWLALLLPACEQQFIPLIPPDIPTEAFVRLGPDAGAALADAYAAWQQAATDNQSGPIQYQTAMAFASLAFAWEQFAWAEESFELACSSRNAEARCWYLLALSQQANSRREAAALSLQKALKLGPAYLPVRLRLAEYLLETERLEQAEELLGQKQANEPAALLGLRGRVALASGDTALALELLAKALKQEPSASRLRYPYGLALRAAGREAEAIQQLALNGPVPATIDDLILSEVGALAQGAEILRSRGNDLALAGQYAEAVEVYRQALAKQEDALTRLNLAIALARSAQPEAAETEFRQALQADPDLPAGWFGLGTMLAEQGRNEEAIAAYQLALQQHPGDHDARFNLANAQRRMGEGDQSIENYQQLVRADPSRIDAQLALAQTLAEQQLWPEALAVLRSSLQAHPADARLALQLARLLAAAPDPGVRDGAAALRLAEHLFRSEASLPHGEVLAMALAELGRYPEAAELQQSLISAVRSQGREELLPELESAYSAYSASQPHRIQ